MLKGRSNYLCLERLEQQALAGGDLPVQTLSDVIILRAWANQTEEGDISTWRERAGRLSRLAAGHQYPTTTAWGATARCIKIVLW